MNYETNPDLVRYWNRAVSLKSAVRYLTRKGMDKETIVKAWKHFAKTYGYSGSVPVPKVIYPPSIADGPWEDIGDGLLYSKRSNKYYKDGVTRCSTSAAHNGWIGAGALLKKVVHETN